MAKWDTAMTGATTITRGEHPTWWCATIVTNDDEEHASVTVEGFEEVWAAMTPAEMREFADRLNEVADRMDKA